MTVEPLFYKGLLPKVAVVETLPVDTPCWLAVSSVRADK